MVQDLACGFQPHLSSGTRSSIFRVPAISWSYSGSSTSLIRMVVPLQLSIRIDFAFYSPNNRNPGGLADQEEVLRLKTGSGSVSESAYTVRNGHPGKRCATWRDQSGKTALFRAGTGRPAERPPECDWLAHPVLTIILKYPLRAERK